MVPLSFCTFLGWDAFFLSKILAREKQIYIRSKIKKQILIRLAALSSEKYSFYVEYFKQYLNHELIHYLKALDYHKIVVASGSDKNLIQDVLASHLKFDEIIANDCKNIPDQFKTCWGIYKLKFLEEKGILPHPNMDLYTDSYDDKPVMSQANNVILIQKGETIDFSKSSI